MSYNENEVEKIAGHVQAIMEILKLKRSADNVDTPKRVAKMLYNELFANRNDLNLDELNNKMTLFPAEGYDEEVTLKGIPFASTCSHHWMPFIGTVDISYTPRNAIVGLSKIPRVVRYFSKRPQLQERLTQNIGTYLVQLLDPKELLVRIVAKHTCVSVRGAESDCETITRFVYGV